MMSLLCVPCTVLPNSNICLDHMLYLYHNVALYCFISVRILVVSFTLCGYSRCKCLYIVQHLYKYLLSALSGEKNRDVINCSIIFLCTKKERKENIFKMDWKWEVMTLTWCSLHALRNKSFFFSLLKIAFSLGLFKYECI